MEVFTRLLKGGAGIKIKDNGNCKNQYERKVTTFSLCDQQLTVCKAD